ncbi:hypothetical protein PbDSM24746_19910 [Paenibacillus macerans]|nr:hypothetical protein PbDSM24746_19910 [Paenibacillus macerans]GBK68295.1 hypothetical protein PbJCM17693_20030 [Paenibacillus macerans]GIP12494.1 hypothetical protein J1TS5_46640 [Paenibacillus macerans]
MTGHWFIPPNIFNYIDKAVFEKQGSDALQRAFEDCLKRIDEKDFVVTRQRITAFA